MPVTTQRTKEKNEDTRSKDPYEQIRQDFLKKRNPNYMICPDPQEISIEMLPIPILQQ